MKSEIKKRLEMIRRGEVPAGYKKTKVGIIPKEWEENTLGDLGVFSKGNGISKSEIKESGFPCIRYGEIYMYHNYYIKKIYSYIGKETKKTSKAIFKGDILFAGSGETAEEIGKCVAFLDDFEAYAGGDIIILSPEKQNSMYLGFLLNQKIINQQKSQLGQGHSVVHIYPDKLKKILLPLPKLHEQSRVADILFCCDKAIEKQEKLIELKKEQKKGLAYKLLTGKIRLANFKGKWQSKHMHEIANEITIINRQSKEFTVLSCTKYSGLVPSLEYFGRKVFSNDVSKYKIVPRNSFAYATNHIEEGSIGYQNKYENALISPMYTVFKTNSEINNDYLHFLLKTDL